MMGAAAAAAAERNKSRSLSPVPLSSRGRQEETYRPIQGEYTHTVDQKVSLMR